MKAKNFRIGNLIYVEDKIVKIERIQKNILGWDYKKYHFAIWDSLMSVNDNRIKPIELNDEWAENFGYECLVEMACDIANQSKCRIEITSENLKKMKVHEIQNLFFAITGNEFQLKIALSY